MGMGKIDHIAVLYGAGAPLGSVDCYFHCLAPLP